MKIFKIALVVIALLVNLVIAEPSWADRPKKIYIFRTYALGYSWRSGTGHRGGSAILGFPQVEQLPSWGIGEFFGLGACRPMPNPNP